MGPLEMQREGLAGEWGAARTLEVWGESILAKGSIRCKGPHIRSAHRVIVIVAEVKGVKEQP